MRLIDADALETVITQLNENGWEITRGEYKLIDSVLFEMPTIEPKQQWIPVTERLPKAYEDCLWTTTDGRVVLYYCDGMFSKYTAWMPLPEPYRED